MRILWFPRLQFDTDRMHITTWREMCREMQDAGHQVRIAVAGKRTNGDFNGMLIPVPIIPVKFLRIVSFWVRGFWRFLVALARFKPEAVILDVFTVWFSLPLLLVPRAKRPVIIIDNRTPMYVEELLEGPRQRLMKTYTRLCFGFCRRFLDGMTVITDYYKEYVQKRFAFPEKMIGVWNSGVDTRRFDPASVAGNQRPDFLRGKFVLMQHGEISIGRGVFETIEALNLLGRDDICLMLVGDVVRGQRTKDEMFEGIRSRDKGGRVFILPPVIHSRIPEFIGYSDCAVMAYPNVEYWNNNNPIKMVEYLSMARPIICTDMWTFRSVMGASACAVYVKENRPALIAGAIQFCYDNRAKLKEWGSSARDIVEHRYSWKIQSQRLVDFLEGARR